MLKKILFIVIVSSFIGCGGCGKKQAQPLPMIETNPKEMKEPLPPTDSKIPKIPEKNVPECDTLKCKGGQDQIIGFHLNTKDLDKMDLPTRLKMARVETNFTIYFEELCKIKGGFGIGLVNTSACFVQFADITIATKKDQEGLILIKANGDYKVLPGMSTIDDWRDQVDKYYGF